MERRGVLNVDAAWTTLTEDEQIELLAFDKWRQKQRAALLELLQDKDGKYPQAETVAIKLAELG